MKQEANFGCGPASCSRLPRASRGSARLAERGRSPAREAPSSSPLVSQWISQLPRLSDQLQRRSAAAAGIAAITARTVDFGASDAPMTPDQFVGLQGLRPDPVGLLGHVDPLQRQRVDLRPEADRPDPREHLPGQDHEVERRRIKAINTGKSTCRARTSRRSSAATAAARATTSPTTSRKVSPELKTKVGKGTTATSRPGVGARGAPASRPKLARRRAASRYVDVAYSLKNHFKIANAEEPEPASSSLPRVKQLKAVAELVTKLPKKNAYHGGRPSKPRPRRRTPSAPSPG